MAPCRAPDEGSASSGQPAARASSVSGPGSAPSPATITPRSVQGRSRAAGAAAPANRVHGAPPGRPASDSWPGRARHGPVGVAGHQRLAQRQVQVHRAGHAARRAAGQGPGPAGQRAPVPGQARPGLGHADLAEPAHRVPVQLELVDGLVGAGAAQLGRPVGGQHQQRHAGLVGLDDRGVEVRRGRARGAQHRGGPAAGLGQAQGQERRRPLVDPNVQPQLAALARVEQRQRQRRAARAGGHDGLAKAASPQLIDEHAGQCRRRVRRMLRHSRRPYRLLPDACAPARHSRG